MKLHYFIKIVLSIFCLGLFTSTNAVAVGVSKLDLDSMIVTFSGLVGHSETTTFTPPQTWNLGGYQGEIINFNIGDVNVFVESTGAYGAPPSSGTVDILLGTIDLNLSDLHTTVSGSVSGVPVSGNFDLWNASTSTIFSNLYNSTTGEFLYSWSDTANLNLGSVNYSIELAGIVSTVPVPAAVWLFGTSLIGLVGMRRKLSRMPQMINNKYIGFICVGLVLVGFNTTAKAADYNWICADNYWDITNCWSPNGLPTSGDNVFVNTPDQLMIDSYTKEAFANSLTLDNAATLWQKVGSLSLTTNVQYIGYDSLGTYTQQGGANNSSSLHLGYNSTAIGNYNLSGSSTTLNVSNSLYVGNSGTGTLNIDTGGVVSNTTGYLGASELGGNSNGTANVSGSSSQWNNSSNLYVGGGGTGILNIDSGGVVSNTNGYLGYLTGKSGTVTISDSGSEWNSSGELISGFFGTGSININSGGVVNSASGIMGHKPTGNGTAIISGIGSKWNSGDLTVGHLGTGSININSGGVVNSATGIMGNEFEGIVGKGTATISDSGSQWNNSEYLYVGDSGTGILSIDTGGVVSSKRGYLGNNSGANGTATISGTGSQWNNSESLNVGDSGTGALYIDSSGVVNSNSGFLGITSSGIGTASISGSGSQWLSTSTLAIGYSGTGFLNIDSGGMVKAYAGSLGSYGGTGTANISGSGSKWYSSTSLSIGTPSTGIGTLIIDSGGVVSNTTGNIYNGTATISGIGSLWNNNNESGLYSFDTSGNLYIGRSGTGTLNIDSGGLVENMMGYLGYSTGGNGTVNISDSGSQWNSSGDLKVGVSGSAGSLHINSGGMVNNIDGYLGDTSYDYLGDTSDGNGTATISGNGSQWNNSGDLTIGNLATGFININLGGAVNNTNGYLGYGTGSNGTSIISGGGSQWNNSDNLYVGGSDISAGGNGEITIENDGALTVGDKLQIWNTGTVTLNGGVVKTQTLDGTGTFNFLAGNLNFTADLLLDASSPLGNAVSLTGIKSLIVDGNTALTGANTLSLDGGVFSTGSLSNNGGFAFNSGTFNLTNNNLVIGTGGLFGDLVQFNAGQKVNVTNSTTVNAGSVLALNNSTFNSTVINNNGQIALQGFIASLGGTALNNAGMLTGSGQVSAVLNNTTGGEVRANFGDELIFTGTGNANNNRISLLGGTVDFRQGLTNHTDGLISGHGTVATGSTTATGLDNLGSLAFSGNTDIIGDVSNTGKIIVSGGATATFHDDVIHNGSEIRVSANSQAVFFGSVSGAGNYTGLGSTFFEGDLLPGNSPALVNFEGDMTLGALSNTTMEIGGLLRGSQYDSFDVGSLLTLAGGLNIELYDLGSGLFTPNLGDTFDLFTAEVLQGEFDLISFVGLGNGLNWKLDYLTDFVNTTDYVRLSVVSSVPIPTGVWLFSTGLICLIGVGRCRKQ